MPVGGSSTVVGLEFENPANEEMREKEEELEENVFDAETKSRAGLNTLTREVTVDIEKEMHEAESCVIHPRQRWFIMWTTLNILVMVFMTFELPYRIAFVPYTEEMSSDEYKEQLGWREIADRTVDIILMVEHCFSYFIAYYDEDFELVIAPGYDWAWPFQDGRALVCKGCALTPVEDGHKALEGGKWGYINKEGKEVVPVKYTAAEVSSM